MAAETESLHGALVGRRDANSISHMQNSLQESHAAATRTADAAGDRCESLQQQLDDARVHIEEYRTKMKELQTQSKKEMEQLQRKLDQLQQQAGDAVSQAERASGDLEKVLTTAQEECRKARFDLRTKTDECQHLQEQQKALSALMASLEVELSAANASLAEARSLVTDNRQALQKHKTWMQKFLVKEEVLLEKLHKETIALEAERQQHDDTKKALSNQTAVAAALLKEKRERDAELDGLKADHAALQEEVAKRKEHHVKAQEHFKKSSQLLQSSKAAIELYEQTLESMQSRMAAIHSSKAQRAADDALRLTEQEKELRSARTEIAALKQKLRQSASSAPPISIETTAADTASPFLLPTPEPGKQQKPQQDERQQHMGSVTAPPIMGEQQHSNAASPTCQHNASLDSRGPAGGDQVQIAAAETAAGKAISGPFQPLHQAIIEASPVLGKRERALMLPAVAAVGAFQMATDTPDELEVFSQDLNSEGKRSPAKKQCLQSVSSNSQESLHSQIPYMERHAIQSKSAPSGMAAHASMHEQLEIPPVKSAPHYPAAAGTRSEPLAKAEAHHSKGQLIAPAVQKQPGTDHFNAKASQLPKGPADESQKDAALPVTTPDSHERARPEGANKEMHGPPEEDQSDVFDAFAAFEGLEEDS